MKFLDASKYRKASIIRELTWMAHLAEQGLNMAVSIRSAQDLLIEEVTHDSKRYHVIAFTKAPGSPLTDVTSDFAIIKQWGRGMGRMHKLGKKDATVSSLVHRMAFPQWNDHVIFTDAFPEAAGEIVHTQWKQYLQELESLPQDEEGYGIVHNDLHHHNFHVHNGRSSFSISGMSRTIGSPTISPSPFIMRFRRFRKTGKPSLWPDSSTCSYPAIFKRIR